VGIRFPLAAGHHSKWNSRKPEGEQGEGERAADARSPSGKEEEGIIQSNSQVLGGEEYSSKLRERACPERPQLGSKTQFDTAQTRQIVE